MNLLSYLGISPQLAGPPRHFGHRAAVIGRATLGAGAWLGASTVIRADGHTVRAGDDLHLGAEATVHIAHEVYPAIIGRAVTIGAHAVVHACEVGDQCVVGDGAVILDGSVVEPGVLIEAGSVVFPRSRLAANGVYAGRPAKRVRELGDDELRERRARVRDHSERIEQDATWLAAAGIESAGQSPDAKDGANPESSLAPGVFIANTAFLAGHVRAARDANIWYGCVLDARLGELLIGARSNVQDNSHLRIAPGGRLAIGADTTIGHNVTMADGAIGARCLIGIGSVLASGTIVADDVFLAAGATTTPGQILESGFLWGGQPAQKMAPLDARKRDLIAATITTYCDYARELRAVQEAQRGPDAARRGHAHRPS